MPKKVNSTSSVESDRQASSSTSKESPRFSRPSAKTSAQSSGQSPLSSKAAGKRAHHFWSKLRHQLKRFWWLVILLFILGAVGYWWTQRQQENEMIETINPEVRDLKRTISFSGYISADKQVNMRFATGGKISYVGAKQGDQVKKGQTIASLDKRSVQKQLDEQLNLYQSQRLTFENQVDTYEDRWLDTEESREKEKDQLALERAVIDVQQQSLAIENYTLAAPFSGLLIEAPFEVTGVQVQPTDNWLLVDPSTLYFQMLVDEVDIDEVEIGQRADISLDARPDQKLAGVVEDIGLKTINTAEGSVFSVQVGFLDPVDISRQRLGMNGEAQLLIEERKQVLSVPIEALITRDGQNYVEVLENEEKQERSVKIGLETDDYVQILEGLSIDDQVILP